MYIYKQTPKRRCGSVRARNKKAALFKRVFLLIVFAAIIFGSYKGVKKISELSFNRPAWTKWTLKKTDISGAEGDLKYEINKYIPFNEGDIITSADTNVMEEMISSAMSQLDSVKVRRNFFNRHLKVSVKRKEALGKISDGAHTWYLAADAKVFKDEALPSYATLISARTNSKINSEIMPDEIVKLFRELNDSKNIKIKEASLDLNKKTLNLELEDGSLINMGDWKDAAGKAALYEDVTEQARKNNMKAPYQLNFKYFTDGKIYLKQ